MDDWDYEDFIGLDKDNDKEHRLKNSVFTGTEVANFLKGVKDIIQDYKTISEACDEAQIGMESLPQELKKYGELQKKYDEMVQQFEKTSGFAGDLEKSLQIITRLKRELSGLRGEFPERLREILEE